MIFPTLHAIPTPVRNVTVRTSNVHQIAAWHVCTLFIWLSWSNDPIGATSSRSNCVATVPTGSCITYSSGIEIEFRIFLHRATNSTAIVMTRIQINSNSRSRHICSLRCPHKEQNFSADNSLFPGQQLIIYYLEKIYSYVWFWLLFYNF